MKSIDEALGRLAEAIRAHGRVPEDVIAGLESLRRAVVHWLAAQESTIVAPEHGRWIVSPAGAQLDLASRPTLRRLVRALVEARVSRPGEPIPRDHLIAAAWPEGSAIDSASLNRLRVALSRLRRAGFEEVLVTTESGWLLDPAVPLFTQEDEREPEETAA